MMQQKQKTENEELDEFTNNLKSQVEIFVNRMKSNSSRGRPIANDSSVQALFMNLMRMHGNLVGYIQEQEEGRVRYEELQDKLAQVKDARAALDALRGEELERKRREQEELERQRQMQLAAKLEVMRKKKAEYLEYQRQVAMQRMADQEREVVRMVEANKANYMQNQQGMQNIYLPYGYQHQGMQHIPSMLPPSVGGGIHTPNDTHTPAYHTNSMAPSTPVHPSYSGYPPPPAGVGYQTSATHPSVGQQGPFNMSGLVATLPQQGHYLGHQPQHSMDQQGYIEHHTGTNTTGQHGGRAGQEQPPVQGVHNVQGVPTESLIRLD